MMRGGPTNMESSGTNLSLSGLVKTIDGPFAELRSCLENSTSIIVTKLGTQRTALRLVALRHGVGKVVISCYHCKADVGAIVLTSD